MKLDRWLVERKFFVWIYTVESSAWRFWRGLEKGSLCYQLRSALETWDGSASLEITRDWTHILTSSTLAILITGISPLHLSEDALIYREKRRTARRRWTIRDGPRVYKVIYTWLHAQKMPWTCLQMYTNRL